MPRYMVERTFVHGLSIPLTEEGEGVYRMVDRRNAKHGVHWLHSFVNDDRTRLFCIYDGPTPESIRRAAEANGLPVDRITEVQVLNPYFNRP